MGYANTILAEVIDSIYNLQFLLRPCDQDQVLSLPVVYLRGRSHDPETAALPGPGAGPEFDAETSKGPGPNLLEDPLLLYLVNKQNIVSLSLNLPEQLRSRRHLSYLLCRR